MHLLDCLTCICSQHELSVYVCTRDDYESTVAHDWRAKKGEITRRFKLKDSKFDVYVILVFSVIGWLI